MALSILGFELFSPTGTSLSTTCTVPSGCGAIVAMHARYTAGGTASMSLTIDGASPTDTVAGTSSDETCAFAQLFASPGAGSKSVVGTFSFGNEATQLVFVYLNSEADSSAFKAKNALSSGPASNTPKNFTLSGLAAGDLVLQNNSTSNSGAFPSLPSGWTNVTTVPTVNTTDASRVSSILATGATQYCEAQAALIWSSLSGVAITPLSAGGFTPGWARPHSGMINSGVR